VDHWAGDRPEVPYRKGARALAVAGAALVFAAVLVDAQHYRSHALLYRAHGLASSSDVAGAERELRSALALPPAGRSPDLEIELRTQLAELLLRQQRGAEAREVARPACRLSRGGAPPADLAGLAVCD
jgi:hypothetical protein